MSIVKNAAAIAKGMSITLGQIFQPTEVENYPDGKGPNLTGLWVHTSRISGYEPVAK